MILVVCWQSEDGDWNITDNVEVVEYDSAEKFLADFDSALDDGDFVTDIHLAKRTWSPMQFRVFSKYTQQYINNLPDVYEVERYVSDLDADYDWNNRIKNK